jgi:hypothetical protein
LKTRLHFSRMQRKVQRWLAAITLPLLSHAALAQPASTVYLPLDSQPTRQALNPQSAVPPAVYHSTWDKLPRGVEDTRLDWRSSNDAVGQFKRGHIDLLRLEQQQKAVP